MLKKVVLIFIIIFSLFAFSCEGPTGEDGENGIDGSTWYSGQGIPNNNIGVDGDYYLDTTTSVVYKKEAGEWTIHITISGEDGENGATWHIGDGIPPAELGEIGDFYLDYLTSDVYKKENNGWIFYLNIQGQDGSIDYQIRLEFGGDLSNSTTEWRISEYETWYLTKFNKNYYANVDSIIFSCSMNTSNDSTKCIAELYNITDSVSIQNTLLESNVTQYVFVDSENIFDSLPDKEITLAIRIKSEHNGVRVNTGKRSYLFLYRN
jgi:hypothetical protein